jgi:hypothetical protein
MTASEQNPGVRGRYMKTFLEAVDRLPPADADAIRQRQAEWVNAVEKAGIISWLPLEANLALTRAVAHVLGPKRTHEFFERLGFESFQTPLLRGLVRSVVAMVGHDPGRYMEWMQKGFGLIFRDSGTWRVIEREPTMATLEVRGLPDACFEDDIWLDSVASSLNALFRLAKCDGSVNVRVRDRKRGHAVMRAVWNAPSNPPR